MHVVSVSKMLSKALPGLILFVFVIGYLPWRPVLEIEMYMSGLSSLQMEYVAMVAFVVTLTFVTILLVCGIIVNMYLYTHGLFRARRMGRSRAFEDRDEDYFSSYISGRYDFTGDYVRKGLFLIAVAILIAGFVILTLILPTLHS